MDKPYLVKNMEKENKYESRMALYMKDIGKMTLQVDMEDYYIQMAIYILVNVNIYISLMISLK